MAKRGFIASENPAREAIMEKIDDLTISVRSYFAPFQKTTVGQQAMGEASLKFAEDCDVKADLYPEVLKGTFKKDDFKLKLGGSSDFFAFKQKVGDAVEEWEKSANICKGDAMHYANKIYQAFQGEDDVKYQPTMEELKAFYKKTVSEKKAGDKAPKTEKVAKPAA